MCNVCCTLGVENCSISHFFFSRCIHKLNSGVFASHANCLNEDVTRGFEVLPTEGQPQNLVGAGIDVYDDITIDEARFFDEEISVKVEPESDDELLSPTLSVSGSSDSGWQGWDTNPESSDPLPPQFQEWADLEVSPSPPPDSVTDTLGDTVGDEIRVGQFLETRKTVIVPVIRELVKLKRSAPVPAGTVCGSRTRSESVSEGLAAETATELVKKQSKRIPLILKKSKKTDAMAIADASPVVKCTSKSKTLATTRIEVPLSMLNRFKMSSPIDMRIGGPLRPMNTSLPPKTYSFEDPPPVLTKAGVLLRSPPKVVDGPPVLHREINDSSGGEPPDSTRPCCVVLENLSFEDAQDTSQAEQPASESERRPNLPTMLTKRLLRFGGKMLRRRRKRTAHFLKRKENGDASTPDDRLLSSDASFSGTCDSNGVANELPLSTFDSNPVTDASDPLQLPVEFAKEPDGPVAETSDLPTTNGVRFRRRVGDIPTNLNESVLSPNPKELSVTSCLLQTPKGRRFKCPYCKRLCKQMRSLRVHVLQVHMKQDPYLCPYCGLTFDSATNLKKHCSSHRDKVKKYACKHCDARFVRSDKLSEHEMAHRGNRPFACSVCNSSFTSAYKLNRHAAIHSGLKPFECDLCDSKFVRSDHYNRHLKIHGRQLSMSSLKSKNGVLVKGRGKMKIMVKRKVNEADQVAKKGKKVSNKVTTDKEVSNSKPVKEEIQNEKDLAVSREDLIASGDTSVVDKKVLVSDEKSVIVIQKSLVFNGDTSDVKASDLDTEELVPDKGLSISDEFSASKIDLEGGSVHILQSVTEDFPTSDVSSH